jgi:DNA-binding MarR family transcriptional regulator
MTMIDFDKTLIPWLGKTSKLIDFYIMDRFKEEGIELTKVQWVMLNRLRQMDGQPQHNLAFLTNRDKASLARLLNTLEKKNLVARIPSKTDQRINHVYLTKQGEKVIKQAPPVIDKIMRELQAEIGTEDILFAINVMKQIQKNINIEV